MITKSSRLFLERAGITPTVRYPASTFSSRSLAISTQEPTDPSAASGALTEEAERQTVTIEPWPSGVV